jgi:hypothetical protein
MPNTLCAVAGTPDDTDEEMTAVAAVLAGECPGGPDSDYDCLPDCFGHCEECGTGIDEDDTMHSYGSECYLCDDCNQCVTNCDCMVCSEDDWCWMCDSRRDEDTLLCPDCGRNQQGLCPKCGDTSDGPCKVCLDVPRDVRRSAGTHGTLGTVTIPDDVTVIAAALTGVCTDCGEPVDRDYFREEVPAPHGWCRDCAQERGLRQCGEDGHWLEDDACHEWFGLEADWSWWCALHASIPATGCDCYRCDPEGWCWPCAERRATHGEPCQHTGHGLPTDD